MDPWYWLIKHGVSWPEIDKKAAEFLFELYKQKNLKQVEKVYIGS